MQWQGTADEWRTVKPIIYAEAKRREPRLAELERELRAIADRDRRERPEVICANGIWYGSMDGGEPYRAPSAKARVSGLVGWGRRAPAPPPRGFWAAMRVLFRPAPPKPGEWEVLRLDDPDVHREPASLLDTAEAYDAVYETLYDLLPDCRGCLCA
jgi:hypothetical protein